MTTATIILREAVARELSRRDMTIYALSKLCNGDPSQRVLRNWLTDGRAITDRKLERVLSALKLRLTR